MKCKICKKYVSEKCLSDNPITCIKNGYDQFVLKEEVAKVWFPGLTK